MKFTSLPVIIAAMICLTVIILVIIACIHDTIKTTINVRSMAKFDKAFPMFIQNNEANEIPYSKVDVKRVKNELNNELNELKPEKKPTNDFEFPETQKIETRPQNLSRYH